MKKSVFIISYLFFVIGSRAVADIASPVRVIQRVHPASRAEPVVGVATAKILIADYQLIRRDFPNIRELSNDQIDTWLVAHTAFIAKTQAEQTRANTAISTSQTRLAQRPPDYNRSLLLDVPGGLIDGKGFGTQDPRPGDHSDGLATLGEAIREFMFQKLVQKVFDDSGTGHNTVGTYAVIDWGFRVKHADGTSSPAGGVLRQAHQRSSGEFSLLNDITTTKVELVLRKYGLTSAGAFREDSREHLNIQGTRDGEIVDFGGFLAVDSFSKAATAFYGNAALLVPGYNFVQPDPDLRVPLELWGTTVSGKEDPKFDNIWIWSHQLAEALASGTADRTAAATHLRNLLEPVAARFASVRGHQCSRIFSKDASND